MCSDLWQIILDSWILRKIIFLFLKKVYLICQLLVDDSCDEAPSQLRPNSPLRNEGSRATSATLCANVGSQVCVTGAGGWGKGNSSRRGCT